MKNVNLKDAFKDYKTHLEIVQFFTWNDIYYLIEIAEQQETLFADSVNMDKEQLSQIVPYKRIVRAYYLTLWVLFV